MIIMSLVRSGHVYETLLLLYIDYSEIIIEYVVSMRELNIVKDGLAL